MTGVDVLAQLDVGTVSLVVGLAAAVPGTLAFLATRHKETGDVFVRRDEGSWRRMLDSIERSDKDMADLRSELDQLRTDLSVAQEHGRNCDQALTTERGLREELQAEVGRLRAEISQMRGDHA